MQFPIVFPVVEYFLHSNDVNDLKKKTNAYRCIIDSILFYIFAAVTKLTFFTSYNTTNNPKPRKTTSYS